MQGLVGSEGVHEGLAGKTAVGNLHGGVEGADCLSSTADPRGACSLNPIITAVAPECTGELPPCLSTVLTSHLQKREEVYFLFLIFLKYCFQVSVFKQPA